MVLQILQRDGLLLVVQVEQVISQVELELIEQMLGGRVFSDNEFPKLQIKHLLALELIVHVKQL